MNQVDDIVDVIAVKHQSLLFELAPDVLTSKHRVLTSTLRTRSWWYFLVSDEYAGMQLAEGFSLTITFQREYAKVMTKGYHWILTKVRLCFPRIRGYSCVAKDMTPCAQTSARFATTLNIRP